MLKKFAPAANAMVTQAAQNHAGAGDEAKLAGQITQVGLEATGDLLKEKISPSDKQKNSDEAVIPFERFVIIIDDLDRCNPSDAIQALARIGTSIEKILYACDIIVVLACDPEILARHASHVFGISLSEGLEGISKYIHAPFYLPTGKTRHHHEALEHYIKAYPGIQAGIADEILKTAESCVGNLPIREILSAIPQAILWTQRAEKVLTNVDFVSHCKIYYLAALISINIPGLLRQSRGLSVLLAALKTHANSPDQPYSEYAKSILELMHTRTDIAYISRVLLGGTSAIALEQAYPIIVGYGSTK